MFWKKPKDHSALGDEALMERVSKGEREAFETLYNRYFSKLVWFARSYTDSSEKAEDFVQDVFIKLIERPEQFDRTKRFSTWIYTVTSNRCKQALRDEKNRLRILEENVFPFKESSVQLAHRSDLKILREKIQDVYDLCSEKEKNIYTLRFEQEMSIKEIAVILSIPEGSVKSGIYYLLKKFAHHLKDFDHEY